MSCGGCSQSPGLVVKTTVGMLCGCIGPSRYIHTVHMGMGMVHAHRECEYCMRMRELACTLSTPLARASIAAAARGALRPHRPPKNLLPDQVGRHAQPGQVGRQHLLGAREFDAVTVAAVRAENPCSQ